MSYTVELAPGAARAVKKLTAPLSASWMIAKAELEEDPRGPNCLKLSGREGYRISMGNLRAIYVIEDTVKIVAVLDVADRKDIYRKR